MTRREPSVLPSARSCPAEVPRPEPLLRPAPLGAVAWPGSAAHDLLLQRADGWICLPDWPPLHSFHPDPLAPPPCTTFVTGFCNRTGLGAAPDAPPARAQYPAPFLWLDPCLGAGELEVAVADRRPALHDRAAEPRVRMHTIRPPGPGTHLYRIDPADLGPLDAGTAGLVAVRPRQNGDATLYRSAKYAYDDGDGSTGYDREFFLVLSEVSAEAQWRQARGRAANPRDQRVDFALLNGRAWPDTLLPSGTLDPLRPVEDASGRPVAPGGNQRLRYQPCSSLVACNAGERVLLRVANLGRRRALMRLDGACMRVAARGGILLRGSEAAGAEQGVQLEAGEVVDVLFTAPPHRGGDRPDRYALWSHPARTDPRGAGGQRTEVRVHAATGLGALPPQPVPHA